MAGLVPAMDVETFPPAFRRRRFFQWMDCERAALVDRGIAAAAGR